MRFVPVVSKPRLMRIRKTVLPKGWHRRSTFPRGNSAHRQGAGTAEQVAELALFLASDASSHISGAEIFIDGAQSLLQG